jgi:hypothetical protein
LAAITRTVTPSRTAGCGPQRARQQRTDERQDNKQRDRGDHPAAQHEREQQRQRGDQPHVGREGHRRDRRPGLQAEGPDDRPDQPRREDDRGDERGRSRTTEGPRSARALEVLHVAVGV